MGRNIIETVLGAVVLVIAGLFMVFAYSNSDLRKVEGYIISANFPMVDGLKEGSDVKMNGVKIGSIADLQLITATGASQYMVNVKMTIDPRVSLPVDSIAMVATESLLGGKYMSLEVGVEDESLKKDGTGRLSHTQAPMRLDDLIGQLIYSKKTEAAPAPIPAPTVAAPVVAPSATNAQSAKPVEEAHP